MKERILNVLKYLKEIEEIKEDIINYLIYLKELDESTKKIWISDVNEFYYYIYSAWEILKPNLKLERKDIESSKDFLYSARNRLSKIISQLKIFKNKNKI